jgi:hypothetical protein
VWNDTRTIFIIFFPRGGRVGNARPAGLTIANTRPKLNFSKHAHTHPLGVYVQPDDSHADLDGIGAWGREIDPMKLPKRLEMDSTYEVGLPKATMPTSRITFAMFIGFQRRKDVSASQHEMRRMVQH